MASLTVHIPTGTPVSEDTAATWARAIEHLLAQGAVPGIPPGVRVEVEHRCSYGESLRPSELAKLDRVVREMRPTEAVHINPVLPKNIVALAPNVLVKTWVTVPGDLLDNAGVPVPSDPPS